MSIRNLIIEKSKKEVNLSEEAKALVSKYYYNNEVYDDLYELYPLYALMKIMAYTKRYAFVIARRNLTTFNRSSELRDNYLIYMTYMKEYDIAEREFAKHFALNDKEQAVIDEVKAKLEKAIAVKYNNDIELLVDIFDVDSSLHKIEGIEYAR